MIFSQIFDIINIGLVILDKDMKVVKWNRWMEGNSGISAEKIIDKLHSLGVTAGVSLNPLHRLTGCVDRVHDTGKAGADQVAKDALATLRSLVAGSNYGDALRREDLV